MKTHSGASTLTLTAIILSAKTERLARTGGMNGSRAKSVSLILARLPFCGIIALLLFDLPEAAMLREDHVK
jgi:hypothetical protein